MRGLLFSLLLLLYSCTCCYIVCLSVCLCVTDSSDIVDQKIKLIMGLIWSLILHYSISMPMWEDEDPSASKDQTPKQRLLEWIRSKIPEKNITNFTSDWNDGTAIAALVDAIGPGACQRSLPLSVCPSVHLL